MIFLSVAGEAFHGRLYNTRLPAGLYCNVYKSGCESVEILNDGSTADGVTIASNSVLALHVGSMMTRNGQLHVA